MGDIIPNKTAAKILGMRYQCMLDEMNSGRLNIGWVKYPNNKIASRRNQFRVYRAKLAAHLGWPDPDHVWPEENEP